MTTKEIASSDIFAQFNPANTFATYGYNISHECAGKTGTFGGLSENGLQGALLSDIYGALRLGKVTDPTNASKKVMAIRSNMNDPELYSAPRCEISWASSNTATRLKMGEDQWFAFGLYLPNWTTTTGEGVIAQWHESGPTVNPFMALAIKGDKLTLTLRYNANTSPTQATNTVQVFSLPGTLPVNKWTYFVVKAKPTWDSSKNPYMKIWRDGTQVFDYKGRIGYNTTQVPFMKVGFYPWGYQSGNNVFTTSAPTKTLLFRTPTYIKDPAGTYTEADVRKHVSDR